MFYLNTRHSMLSDKKKTAENDNEKFHSFALNKDTAYM